MNRALKVNMSARIWSRTRSTASRSAHSDAGSPLRLFIRNKIVSPMAPALHNRGPCSPVGISRGFFFFRRAGRDLREKG